MTLKQKILLSLFTLASLILISCGSDSKGSNNKTVSLSGTAAVGAAISGGTLTAKCADGSGFSKKIITSTDGTWSGEINNDALPCALKISGGTPAVTLHSFVVSAGVTNITPLTDLGLALITSSDPASWFTNFTGSALDITNAGNQLLDALEAKGFTIPSTGNPFTTAFSADGTGWDALLDDIGAAIAADPSLADYDALLTLVKDGNIANLPAPADNGDIEDPEGEFSLLTDYADTYTVECTAINPNRGVATRDHLRGSITIAQDGGIDFDTGTEFNFTANDINALFDRTMLEGDIRRIHINYDEDDSGRRIDIYLNDSLEITEIRYQDGEGGRTRAAIGGTENCTS